MRAETLCKRATEFGFTLLGAEFAIDAREHFVEKLSATQKSVMWVRDRAGSIMTSNPAKVSDYISILERQNYSYLMMDGGIIQIAFIYEDRAIIRHRLAYHPCPFDISAHDVAAFDGGLVDLIQNVFLDDLENNVLLRSPIRFD
jgi:hypothetical protein